MITDILINRTEGDISIHTATEADKEDYIALELKGDMLQSLVKVGADKEIDMHSIIWGERYKSDCIMFAIVENATNQTVGFCEIENVSADEPTIGITIAEGYRGKGYGYLATKMMIEEGWKIFTHPYFIWEVEQENIASKKLAKKLGGVLINHRCVLPESIIQVMRKNGMEINQDDFPDSVERYKIERP